MKVLGIMSGTSIDSVDYLVCTFGRTGAISFEKHWSVSFPRTLRQRLHAAASNLATAHEVGQLHHDLGRFYALGAEQGRGMGIQLAGLHGQTIFHQPNPPRAATFQIGEPIYLARVLNVPVISNFRAADLALGGQGAPLATLFHQQAFAQKGKHIAVNNLGGISNVTSIDWRSRSEPRIHAFDTGPANVLIDLAVRQGTNGRAAYDRDGKLAGRGTIHHQLIKLGLKHPFFRKAPPKSTGRELFGEPFYRKVVAENESLSTPDWAATFAEFTARSIALNYKLHLPSTPDLVILCGGGALNPFLVERIRIALAELNPHTQVSTSEKFGWHPAHIEAAAFALLAWRTHQKLPGNIPATTGASEPALLGQITQPG
jgi:anhydro-N-acetylmuramic acid kinase